MINWYFGKDSSFKIYYLKLILFSNKYNYLLLIKITKIRSINKKLSKTINKTAEGIVYMIG